MSKCDFEVSFDRPDRMYKNGDVVHGSVTVQVNRSVHCRRLLILGCWETHGKGNTAREDYFQQDVFQGELEEGRRYEFPFEFEIPDQPWTYRGHHLNIDHYVKVRVDIPWAFDPKHQSEFIVSPSATSIPMVPPGGGGDPQKAITGKVVGTVIGGLMIAFGIPFIVFFGLGFLIMLGGAAIIFFTYRNDIAERRLGHVEFEISPAGVAPGDEVEALVRFLPKTNVKLNRVLLSFTGREVVVSGSGTNRTTHTHKLHHEEVLVASATTCERGKTSEFRGRVRVPDGDAYSVTLTDNSVNWSLSLRLDIPLWPDWLQAKEFSVVPPICLDATRRSEAAWIEPVGNFDESPEIVQVQEEAPLASLEPGLDFDDAATRGPATAEAMLPSVAEPVDIDERLLQLCASLSESNRFGDERAELVESRADEWYRIAVTVERTSYSYGIYDEADYRNGRTIAGFLTGTRQRVSIQLPESENEQVAELHQTDVWHGQARPLRWDDLYDRLEMRGVPTVS